MKVKMLEELVSRIDGKPAPWRAGGAQRLSEVALTARQDLGQGLPHPL